MSLLFSKTYCPYSRKAKAHLDSIGLKYVTIELDSLSDSMLPKLQELLFLLSGIKTVPQLYVSGRFIGDSSVICNLPATGKR